MDSNSLSEAVKEVNELLSFEPAENVSTYDGGTLLELGDPLGYDTPDTPAPDPTPAQLDQPSEAPTTDVESAPPEQENTEPTKADELPEEILNKYSDLDKYLQHKFGVNLEEAFEAIQATQQMRQQQIIQQQNQQLQTDWGVDQQEFNHRLELVKEEFKKLPPEKQQALDDIQGAKLLWEVISARQASVVTSPTIPANPRPAKRGQEAYDYRQSQIMAMSPAQYAAEADKITRAYAARRVLMDVK